MRIIRTGQLTELAGRELERLVTEAIEQAAWHISKAKEWHEDATTYAAERDRRKAAEQGAKGETAG